MFSIAIAVIAFPPTSCTNVGGFCEAREIYAPVRTISPKLLRADKPNMPNKIETTSTSLGVLALLGESGAGIKLCKAVVSSVVLSVYEFILITYLEIRSPIFKPAEAAALAAERMALKIAIPPPADRARARIGASSPRVIAIESVSNCAEAAIAVAASHVMMFKLSFAMPNDQNPVIHA